jgi:hypothetical protein
MKCPKCQAENAGGHAYCLNCYTELNRTASPAQRKAAKVKEANAQSNRVFHTGWRVVRLMLWAFCLFAGIVIVRGIDWDDVMHGINTTKTGVDREVAKPVKPTRATPEPERRKPPSENKSKSKIPATANKITEASLWFQARVPPDLISDTSSGAALDVEPAEAAPVPNVGLVVIKSYTRARVYIDGQFSGYTPRAVKLTTGEHSVTLLADGYEEWSRKLRLRGSQQVGIMAALVKKTSG